MYTYTPTAAPLTDIELPQDVIDDVVVGTVDPAFEQLADAVALAQNAIVMRGLFSAGATANSGYFPVTIAGAAYPAGAWTAPSGTEIQVPRAGVYMVTAMIRAESASAANPAPMTVQIQFGGVNAGTVLLGFRWSTTTGDDFVGTGRVIFNVTDPATDLLSFFNNTGVTLTTIVGYDFIVQYIGEAT